jgi:flagellar export protein FliJ
MAFQFSLAAVLIYRESLEQREYIALEQIQQAITRTEAHILQVEEWRATAAQQRSEELARGVHSVQLQQAYEHELALERYRDLQQEKLRELKNRRQQQLKSYELARQKRKVLDELRGHQFEAYTRGQARRQQHLLDELFLARRRRSQ